MIQTKCIKKFRDKQNKIYGYRLIDLNGQTQDVTPDDLKKAMKNNKVNVLNLTLTSDGRLIDKKEEKQLENKSIMPNKVNEPVTPNTSLIDLASYCANKIAKSMNGDIARIVDRDTSKHGCVDIQFDAGKIIYKGIDRELHVCIDFTKGRKTLNVGLLSVENLCTEAEKSVKLSSNITESISIIDKFADEYVDYVKRLRYNYYKVMLKYLDKSDKLNDEMDKLTNCCKSNIKVIELPNATNIYTAYDSYKVNADLYPYKITSRYDAENIDIVCDWEEKFVVAFVKDGYTVDTVIYSENKKNIKSLECINIKKIEKSVSKYYTYCDKVIGLPSREYYGHTEEKISIKELEDAIEKEGCSILIKVDVIDTNDGIQNL